MAQRFSLLILVFGCIKHDLDLALHRALHNGRPVFLWCWRALANSATVWAGLRLVSFAREACISSEEVGLFVVVGEITLRHRVMCNETPRTLLNFFLLRKTLTYIYAVM